MYKTNNQSKVNPLLFFGIILVLFLIFTDKLKNLFAGLTNAGLTATDGLKDAANNVLSVSDMESKRQVESVFQPKNFTPKNSDKIDAETAYSIVNDNEFSFSQKLSQTKAAELNRLLMTKKAVNLAGILHAYGSRYAINRQHRALGFIWDNTKGTLIEHITRYFPDNLAKQKAELLKRLEHASKSFLN